VADTNRPLPIEGRKTNNAAAPTSDHVAALTAVANAAAPSYTEGRQVLLSVDLSGAMRVSLASTSDATKAEDAASASGDRGMFILGVRNDASATLTDTDGDYGAIQIDSAGRVGIRASAVEDNAAGNAFIGVPTLGVRNDARAGLTSTDGDFGGFAIDSAGRLIPSIEQQEDAAAASGFFGAAILGVRNDNQAAQTSTDGDFGAVSIDSAGRLFARAEKTEDAGHASGDIGSFALGVRNDALAALTSTDLDYTPLATDLSGAIWTRLKNANGDITVSNPIPVDVQATRGTLVDSGQLTSASLAAGASVALAPADIGSGTGKLIEITATSSVRLKVEAQTFTASTGTTKRTWFVEAGEPFTYQPKDPDEITQASGAGNKLRVLVTNMDPIQAADVYGTVTWVEV